MADVAAGGDTKKLADMMEKGQLKPQEILPKFFAAMDAKAKQGWDVYTKSVAYQQGQAQNAFAELVRSFTFNGGDQGFANFWKAIQESLRELTPLAKFLGEAFYDLSTQFGRITNTLKLAKELMKKTNGEFSEFYPELSRVAEILLMMKSRWFLLFKVLDGVFLLIEDFFAAMAGKESAIKSVFDSFSKGEVVEGFSKLNTVLDETNAYAILAVAGLLKLLSVFKNMIGLGDGNKKTVLTDVKPSESGSSKIKEIVNKTKIAALPVLGFLAKKASVPAATVYGVNDFVSNVDANSTQFNIPAGVGGIGMINTYRQAMIGIEQGKALRAKEAASWDYLSPNVQDFIKSMTTFQGAPALSERLNDMTNFRGVTNQQGQIVIENLNMNVSGNNAPPELLARKIVDETASRVLQLTPNSY